MSPLWVIVALAGCGRIALDPLSDSGATGQDASGDPNRGDADASGSVSSTYRRSVDISNAGASLVAFPIKVTLQYTGNMQPDFDDVRFTAADGVTPFSYWRESYIDSTSAEFWVNVPAIPSGASSMLVFYGDPAAATTSNGNATFSFFDDFRGTSVDTTKWGVSVTGTGSVTVNDGLICANPSLDSSTAILSMLGVSNYGIISGLHVLEFNGSLKNAGVPFRPFGFAMYVGNDASQRFISLSNFDLANGLRITNQTSSGVYSSSATINGYTTGVARYRLFGDGTTTHVFVNGVETTFSTGFPASTTPDSIYVGPIATGGNNPNDVSLSWLLIRKRASVEPTTSVGPEEML